MASYALAQILYQSEHLRYRLRRKMFLTEGFTCAIQVHCIRFRDRL